MNVCTFLVMINKVHQFLPLPAPHSNPRLPSTFLPLKFVAGGHDIECQVNVKTSHSRNRNSGKFTSHCLSRENKRRHFAFFVQRKASFSQLSLLLRCLSRSLTFHCGASFWPCCTACGPLIPQPGIEPRSLAVTAQSPNDWEFPSAYFLKPYCQGCVEMKLPVYQQVLSKEPHTDTQ